MDEELQVAYVLLRFPWLSETFVAEEIGKMQGNRVRLHIYSLLRGHDALVHPSSQRLLPQVRYAPGVFSASLWFAQAYYLFGSPVEYVSLLLTALRQPSPRLSFYLKRFDVFLKAVWVAKQLRPASVKLVHAHFAWLSALAGMIIGRLLDIPLTVTAHAYDIYSVKNDLLRLAASRADQIVTISETNKRAILTMNSKLQAEKVKVIHCGIDLGYFRPPPAKSAGSILQITSVGRLASKKGHEYLIRACSELQAQGIDFHCVVVGSGELEQSLKNLVDELGLAEEVTLAGAQSQGWVRDRLCSSDLFVLASITDAGGDRDGIPVSIMEAMAMEVPVISTRVSGIPELVHPEITGLLVPERDPKALAAAMIRMANDKSLRRSVTQNALDLVRKEYDINKSVGELRMLFQETLEARAAAGVDGP
jgi:glycosyltransferase involved in cell wall biosynthesis